MKEIIQSKYARLFWTGLALNIICAWFSAGFYHPDEHFQVFEFSSYKLNQSPASILPWEFHQKMRSSLLPALVFVMGKIMVWLNVYNPFILAFTTRLVAGALSWFIACKFCVFFLSKKQFKTPVGEKIFILLSFFLWFVPYLNVRFTAENMSGIALLYGVYFILRAKENNARDSMYVSAFNRYVISGILFGISFFMRPQISFALIGFFAWLLIINKTRLTYLIAMSVSAAFALGVNVIIDRWFYGVWSFTPFNYYHANITLHIASQYGTSPWWFYFYDFLMKAFPPLSFILLFMFFAGCYKNLKHPFVWIIIPFVIIHFFIEHKEIRFFFPVTFIFIFIVSLGFDYLLTRDYYLKVHKYIYALSLIISLPLLLFRTLAPSNIAVNYLKYLYYTTDIDKTELFYLRKDMGYYMYGLKTRFYVNRELKESPVSNFLQMDSCLQKNKPQYALFFSKNQPNETRDSLKFEGYKTELAYCILPSWVLKYDINQWEERAQIWSIFRLTKVN